MVIEVMPQLTRSQENSVCQFLVVGVALFRFRQDLADIVDWSLYTLLLRFFLTLYHDDDADHPVGCRHV
jgi:hypothetical protein